MTKIKTTLISDLHGRLPELPGGDLLIIAGDIFPDRDSIDGQVYFGVSDFRIWLENLNYQQVVGVCGNHDFLGHDEGGKWLLEHGLGNNLTWNYLEDYGLTFAKSNGVLIHSFRREYAPLKIWGSPWSGYLRNWAFGLHDTEADKWYDRIPEDTDVLITHGPAFGYGDKVIGGENVGSNYLLRTLRRVKPALHVCGHIHEDRGLRHHGETMTINASYLDENYDPYGWVYHGELEYTFGGKWVPHFEEVYLGA